MNTTIYTCYYHAPITDSNLVVCYDIVSPSSVLKVSTEKKLEVDTHKQNEIIIFKSLLHAAVLYNIHDLVIITIIDA